MSPETSAAGSPKNPHWLVQALRFGLVGLLATAMQVGVFYLLARHARLQPLLANLLAFACAFTLAFAGHFLWTFAGNRAAFTTSLQRYFVISVCGLAFNTALVAVLNHQLHASAGVAALSMAVVTPPLSYLLSRAWGFRSPVTAAAEAEAEAATLSSLRRD